MANILETSMDYLAQFDPEIASQMQSEYQRQQRNIELIASESVGWAMKSDSATLHIRVSRPILPGDAAGDARER